MNDAGYTPTDWVIRNFLFDENNHCQWFTSTNADNVYGSDVVHNVRNYPNTMRSSSNQPPDMLLIPTDSRNFAELGKLFFKQIVFQKEFISRLYRLCHKRIQENLE